MSIRSLIRTVPHYPKNGVMFRDITTLLKDPVGFRITINEFVQRYTAVKVDRIAAIESRGFIIGAALAFQLGVGFVPIRKKGKLPAETIGHDYEQPVVLASMSKRRSSSLNGLCLFEHRLPSATGPKDSW